MQKCIPSASARTRPSWTTSQRSLVAKSVNAKLTQVAVRTKSTIPSRSSSSGKGRMNAGGGSSSYAIQPAWSARRSRSIETSRDASTTGSTESSTGWAIAAFDHNRAGTMGPWPSRRQPKLDAHKLRADFPVFEQPIHGKPLAFLDSAVTSQKPRQVLDAMREFYAHLVRERAPRRLHAVRARDRRLRGRPREGAGVPERAVDARGDLHAQGHRGAQPRRLRVGPRQPRPGRRRRGHRARAPLELRAVAADRAAAPAPSSGCIPIDDHGELRMDLLDEVAGDARGQGRRREPRLELARDDQPDRDAHRLGARARRDHGRRRRAGRAAPPDRRADARRRLRRVLVAQDVRPDRRGRRSGAGASCSRRCRRSTSAAR